MTIGPTTRRLSIALLAQVVFCLVAAPILAAEQWSPPVAVAKQVPTPTNSGVKITAAFDASNVRPEEVSDAEQKRGKPRAGGGKAPGLAGGANATTHALVSAFRLGRVHANPPAPSPFKGEGWGEGESFTLGNGRVTAIAPESRRVETSSHGTLDPHPSPLPGREREQERQAPRPNVSLKTPRQAQPAFQPTGPPLA